MAKSESNVNQWVDERLAALDAGGDWQPDASRGLARLRDRERTMRRRRIEWILASVVGAAACFLLAVFFSPGACARPRGCSSDQPPSVAPAASQPAPKPVEPLAGLPAAELPARPAPAPAPAKPARPLPATQPAVNFKEFGSSTASIVCEVYSDYECPTCALLYKETIPLLMEHYVLTGKVRLLHRDFPLVQHPYARLAARYANAAGTIGQYELVVNQLFQTQNLWSRDGSVDLQVAQVLPPGAIQKVRALVATDAHLDDTVMADLKMGEADHIDHTPTLVIVSGGKRQALPGAPPFAMLKTYLDQLLSAR
jgi:protein-disulfide isomerase